MEQITIGAIEGFCVGGGVALALALDFRVMGRDADLRVPEIGLGMNMSWQSIPRMLHLIGPARTKQPVILADQRISADVADPGHAFDAAMALAAKVAAQPPLSVAMTKLTVNRLAHALDDLASHVDPDQFALASFSEDHKEGVAALPRPPQATLRGTLERDDFYSNRYPTLAFCLSMSFFGKPVPAFPDQAPAAFTANSRSERPVT